MLWGRGRHGARRHSDRTAAPANIRPAAPRTSERHHAAKHRSTNARRRPSGIASALIGIKAQVKSDLVEKNPHSAPGDERHTKWLASSRSYLIVFTERAQNLSAFARAKGRSRIRGLALTIVYRAAKAYDMPIKGPGIPRTPLLKEPNPHEHTISS